MQDNLLAFNKDGLACRKIALKRSEKGDLIGALSALLSAYKIDQKDYKTISEIAKTYCEMGVLEQSNQFWFYYLLIAPKNLHGKAYEELAVNFFYLDNLSASAFYFQKKIELDGFISEEALEGEISEFLSFDNLKKTAYHLAYPFEKADYSGVFKMARRAFSAGDFDRAVKIYSSVPNECMTEDAFGELAISYYMIDNVKEALIACKNSLSFNGENITAYCNMATFYNSEGDLDKSEYYYDLALKNRKYDVDEPYKLAGCAIEQKDYFTTKECLDLIVKEKPFDPVMNFFYALSLFNVGEEKEGVVQMEKVVKICPDSDLYCFYLDYLKSLRKSNDKDEYLPIAIDKDLPKRTTQKYLKIIDKLNPTALELEFLVKDQETFDALVFGLSEKDEAIAKKCALLLSASNSAKAEKKLRQILMQVDALDQTKRLIVFSLILNGKRSKITLLAGDFLAEIKHKKLIFEKDEGATLYTTAYALAVSKLVFWRGEEVDKLAFSANKTYKRLQCVEGAENLTFFELAVLMIDALELKNFITLDKTCILFGVDKNKVEKFALAIKE